MSAYFDTEWDLTREVPNRYVIKSVDPDKPFIGESTSVLDADQGMHQDCSFMGALCSFALYRNTDKWKQFRLAKDELQKRVLHIEHNTGAAKKSRKFLFDFYAFDSWRTISVDDRLHMWSVKPYDKPALADEPRTGVYWGCFIEKVRLNNSYSVLSPDVRQCDENQSKVIISLIK